MKKFINFTTVLLVLSCSTIKSQQHILIDKFENLENWKVISSDAAKIKVKTVEEVSGNCFRIDYEFIGAGYCGIEKVFPFDLPNNYKFTFDLKGESPKNNLEFKLIDKTGDNVWWKNQRNFEFPSEWRKIIVRKRDIDFAWGPVGGGAVKSFDKIQIVIAAAEGGKGSIFLDELTIVEMPLPNDKSVTPNVYSSNPADVNLNFVCDDNLLTSWKSKSKLEKLSLTIDLQSVNEIGGLVIHWNEKDFATNYDVSISNDRVNWEKVSSYSKNNLSLKFIYLENTDTRYIRLNLNKSSRGKGYSLKEIEIKDYKFSKSLNDFFTNVASYYKEGSFPKYFYNKQSYWSIIGVSEDEKEALINEQGMIEVDKQSFSLEPFIQLENKLITWNDVKTTQSLEKTYLPIPSVKWEHPQAALDITAFAFGEQTKSNLLVRYRLFNNTKKIQSGKLIIAIRPYQVNPKWQFLNNEGGIAKIKEINFDGNKVLVNNDKKIIPFTKPHQFGAAKFSDGEIIDYLFSNSVPTSNAVADDFGFASGCMIYYFELKPAETNDFIFIIPFYQNSDNILEAANTNPTKYFEEKLAEVKNLWQNKLDKIKIHLPPSGEKIINTIKSNLAYILINKDGPAIQPGSRSYERSWIRDGALTSSALLRLGLRDEVKNYLNWFAQYQFPSGKIPCVVDKRGADPTPENDSHGEFIYAILQYFKFTHDTLFLRSKLQNIISTVDYIEFLTNQRKTEQYKKQDSIVFYGLMPESISHEGYSAKPMHSYWDNFFTLRGLTDAVEVAQILNEKTLYERLVKVRNEFETNLHNSIKLAIKIHNIDYIPGCAELGDFDATSTTIALFPCNEHKNLPQKELLNTFQKYYDFALKRMQPETDWINYTPYELRIVGSFICLNQRERAHKMLDFFFTDQRPQEWNHWAEVVWKNINDPKFIGDMPHTWVGSDYINSVRLMFIYENDLDTSLILGAGLKSDWINSNEGVSISNLPTYYGDVSYSIKKVGNQYKLDIGGSLNIPNNKIIFKNFRETRPIKVLIDGISSYNYDANDIIITKSPTSILIEY